MYSQRDVLEMDARIRRGWVILLPAEAAIAAALVFALVKRVHWLALAAGALLVVVAMAGIIGYLWPNLRYRRFLRDMASGLSRDVRGVIVAVSDEAELQDGAMVLPVRVQVENENAPTGTSALSERIQRLESDEDTREERIVYLNASKRELLPPVGTAVTLHCFGRHIKAVEAETATA